MIRVCYVLSTSEKSGGANRSLLELLKHLDRTKIDPFVLMRRHGDIEEELKLLNIPVTIIPFINSVTTGDVLKDNIKKLCYRLVLPHIKKYYKKNNIELVHNNSMPALAGMEAAYKLGIPYICHIREDVEKGLGVSFLDKQHHLKVANSARSKIAISNFIKEIYSGYMDNIDVLYDGLDTAVYYEEKEILEKTPIVISIYGNLDEQKGQLVAVKALEMLHKNGDDGFILNIVGNQKTDYGELVRKYVIEKGVRNVQFVDTITSTDKLRARRLNDDINLICSSAEGLGRVTIESMLAGCLTIGASAGATNELIDNQKTGLLVRPNDYQNLANVLQEASKDKETMKEVAKAGQRIMQDKFNIKKYSLKILSIYESII